MRTRDPLEAARAFRDKQANHAYACVDAIEAHCGGDPAKVGQMVEALKGALDWFEGMGYCGEDVDAVRAALAPQETEP